MLDTKKAADSRDENDIFDGSCYYIVHSKK